MIIIIIIIVIIVVVVLLDLVVFEIGFYIQMFVLAYPNVCVYEMILVFVYMCIYYVV